MRPNNILIVEDEVIIADTIQRYLETKAYKVVGSAISYAEAEQLYDQKKPDLVLIDIRLSGARTGIDFARFLRRQSSPIPFVYLTSQLDSRTLDAAKATFPAGYLSKPIQKESLYATIEIALHNYRAQEREAPKLVVQTSTGNHLVPLEDILYLQAEHIYVKVILAEDKSLVQRGSLKQLLDDLPADQFVQTHRSYAVNQRKITRWNNEAVYLGDTVVPVSRSRRNEVQARLDTGALRGG